MSKEKKLRAALWLGVALLLAASVLWVKRPQSTAGHAIASVSVGDQVVATIDLTLAEDQELSILEETGLPITFQVKDHAIRFLDSDCPDKICINTGFLKNDLEVASCLPNRTSLFVSVDPG